MAKNTLRCIEGTKDYFGDEGKRFSKAMAAASDTFWKYGYEQITTPVFERTELFARGIGEATDIVEKEMYTFQPSSDSLTLRPEGTAGVVRAYLQHSMHKQGGISKLWYAGSMFRRERPQKGRQRQFNQVGIEALGSSDPLLDAEVIAMGLSYYSSLGITGIKTRLNSIGCNKCRPGYIAELKKAVEPILGTLCKSCQTRYEKNVLRIVDCKKCADKTKDLPASYDHLCDECDEHFSSTKMALDAFGVNYDLDKSLVRGLDYYTKTVFEYTSSALGAQDAIGGGGRYDGLVEELGGPSVPAVGFAIGVERVMIAMEALSCCNCSAPLMVYGVGLGETGHRAMAGLISRVRKVGMSADMDYEGKSMKAQMRTANRRGALLALILGESELEKGIVVVKDMREENGEQIEIPLDQFTETLRGMIPQL